MKSKFLPKYKIGDRVRLVKNRLVPEIIRMRVYANREPTYQYQYQYVKASPTAYVRWWESERAIAGLATIPSPL